MHWPGSLAAYFDIVKARAPILLSQCMLFGEKIAARNHDATQARVDLWAAAFAEMLAMCHEIGVDDTLPTAVMKSLQRTSAAGRGGQEFTALFETLISTNRGS
jgi:hypothetical protein